MDSLIPTALRRQRNQRRLTLEAVSGATGMSPQHLSEIESGKRDQRLSSCNDPLKSCSGELVQVDDGLIAGGQPVEHEAGTNKTCDAGHHKGHTIFEACDNTFVMASDVF